MVVVYQRQAAAGVEKRATACRTAVFGRLHHNCANAFSDSTLVGPKQQGGVCSGVVDTMPGIIQTLENYIRP